MPSKRVEALLEALKDDDPGVVEGAIWGLKGIHDSAAVEPIVALFKHKSMDVRLRAVSAFQRGWKGTFYDARAIEPLMELAKKTRSAELRAAAIDALESQAGPDQPGLEELLLRALKDEDPSVRRAAGFALGGIFEGHTDSD